MRLTPGRTDEFLLMGWQRFSEKKEKERKKTDNTEKSAHRKSGLVQEEVLFLYKTRARTHKRAQTVGRKRNLHFSFDTTTFNHLENIEELCSHTDTHLHVIYTVKIKNQSQENLHVIYTVKKEKKI